MDSKYDPGSGFFGSVSSGGCTSEKDWELRCESLQAALAKANELLVKGDRLLNEKAMLLRAKDRVIKAWETYYADQTSTAKHALRIAQADHEALSEVQK